MASNKNNDPEDKVISNRPTKRDPVKKNKITLREGSCLATRIVPNIAALKKIVTSFAKSPLFSMPYSKWENETLFFYAYIALGEGWGAKVDVQRGIEILKAGYERRLYVPTRVLGESYHLGYYGQPVDVRKALAVLRDAFDMAGDDPHRAESCFGIGYAYTDLNDTCWNTTYALSWFRLYFAYGGLRDKQITERAKELQESCEGDSDPDSADYLVEEFNDNIYAFHKIYDDGGFTSTEGIVGSIVKNPFSGDLYMELMPSVPVQMPPDNPDDFSLCIRCFMKDPDDLKGLTAGEKVRLRGKYTSEKGPALLFTDCELYREPPISLPPMPQGKGRKRRTAAKK